jgi:uncharacterized membrane protein YjjP (DUF1212 family)
VNIVPSEAVVKYDILPDEKLDEYKRELRNKLTDPASKHKDVTRAELANLELMKQFNALAEDDHEGRMTLVAQIDATVKEIIKKRRKYRIYRRVKTAGLVAAAVVVIPVVLTVAVAAMLSAPVVLTADRR